MRSYRYEETPIGRIALVETNGAVSHLLFSGQPLPRDAQEADTPLLREAGAQLRAYFAGERTAFTLPLAPEGTPFQQKVWQALCEIPYGETKSYGEIAAAVGNPKACRAVGTANHNNPISIFIPCHRVIGKNGSLTGYGGGLPVKEALLKLEHGLAKR